MTSKTGRALCVTCNKEKRTVQCDGCSKMFCHDDLPLHRQDLTHQLDQIHFDRDSLLDQINQQTDNPQTTELSEQINRWEQRSIALVQKTADQCREILLQHAADHIPSVKEKLARITDQLKRSRQENDFNEIDLSHFTEQLTQLTKQLQHPSSITVESGSETLVNSISVVVSPERFISSICITNKTLRKQNAITVAGGNEKGQQLHQLNAPYGIYVDDDQSIYIADSGNHRIVRWHRGATVGQVVAGGNGQGDRLDQLDRPSAMIVDKNSDAILICDQGNRRVVRWPRRNGTQGQTIISDIHCSRLAMDSNGYLYVSDTKKYEVRRWRIGGRRGAVVAGGNGQGSGLNQLNVPTFLFVDSDQSVYVSDWDNNRVMKWSKGANEGVVVAGGDGQGNGHSQLNHPQGVAVDHLGNVYVADLYNHRIMRWLKGSRAGSIIAGGGELGEQPSELHYPSGLAFDREGNLYVSDWGSDRIQKLDIAGI